MTSKLTRERIEQYANDPRMCNINDEIRELARMALAAMDSEPVAEVLSSRPGNDTSTIDRALPVGTRLYHHAQQPVGNEFIPKNLDRALGVLGMALPESKEEFNLQSERWIQRLIDRVIRYADEFKEQPAPGDGIEAAAKWIDQQREAYDSEHGWSDPDTGSFEFGNDAQREYSSTLEELAEGIRALHPNAGMQPAPVVPAEWTIADAVKFCLETGRQDAGSAMDAWNACRTATLQAGNSPAHSGLRPEQIGVSPAQDHGWIPVSERMPERGDYLVTDGSDFDVQTFDGEQFYPGFVWEDKITHWMPLPSAPKEVNHG
ncbi:DUF551 domain-containing protein [Raoultella planticola]|uniref:DUF551 domain-containing protein n=1 Tax=Raoultella planticola TaxID=575 RepID=UPI001CCCC3A7|nr:DUF551 domain-containing protein [Raoultella planticola]MBZ7829922.1 DUF551 domain-containing protein [Raoultella planticola]